jgi:serine/threonine protein kinase
MFVVMEYFPGDTLFKWVINQHMHKPKQQIMRNIKKVFKQILKSIKSFHAIGILHQDLKLENILISDLNDNA